MPPLSILVLLDQGCLYHDQYILKSRTFKISWSILLLLGEHISGSVPDTKWFPRIGSGDKCSVVLLQKSFSINMKPFDFRTEVFLFMSTFLNSHPVTVLNWLPLSSINCRRNPQRKKWINYGVCGRRTNILFWRCLFSLSSFNQRDFVNNHVVRPLLWPLCTGDCTSRAMPWKLKKHIGENRCVNKS